MKVSNKKEDIDYTYLHVDKETGESGYEVPHRSLASNANITQYSIFPNNYEHKISTYFYHIAMNLVSFTLLVLDNNSDTFLL